MSQVIDLQCGDVWVCLTTKAKLSLVPLNASLEKLHAFVCLNKNELIDSHFSIITLTLSIRVQKVLSCMTNCTFELYTFNYIFDLRIIIYSYCHFPLTASILSF